MTRHWTLREEMYRLFHQWQALLAFGLLGCLVGGGISYLLPTHYIATTQIYVGLNPYRAFSDTKFLALASPKHSNLDDYKNWQMSQLASVVFLEEFLQPTLDELKNVDPYWSDFDVAQLGDLLRAEWRSAGTWSLVARGRTPEHADQAARIWGNVVAEGVRSAVLSARQTFMIDEELQAIAAEQVRLTTRQETLTNTENALAEWVKQVQKLPKDQPLSPADRWQVLSLATLPAQFTPAWMTLLDEQPELNAPLGDYLQWVEQVMTIMDVEIDDLNQRILLLDQERERLTEQYSLASDRSFGLSPNLEVENIEYLPPRPIKSTGNFMAVGALIGLFSWLVVSLVRITTRDKGA